MTTTLINIFLPPPQEYSPMSFIFEVSKKNRLETLTMTNNFPENWVKKKDITSLIQLINNTTKSDCYLNPLSSSLPFNDYAEIGGYARIFIQSYKDKKKLQLGLYSCPKVDKEINDDLLKWWEKENKKIKIDPNKNHKLTDSYPLKSFN